ncbi:MAG: class I SAM-dependent methyltransferase [Candidatus Diapherotrites archaeon]|nr:class I SAM-dependent methyltransferase [Candidatus Diapherotrites archaeon]
MVHTDARRWDRIYREVPLNKIPWNEGRPSRDLVALVKNKSFRGPVLDICCGIGTNAIYAAKKGFEAIGIDISEKAIEIAKENSKKAKVDSEAKFVVGDVLMPKFPDKEFGLVFDRGCLHHIHPEDRKGFIGEIKRVLKPKGKYHVTCFSELNDWPDYTFTKELISELFSKDFRILKIGRRTYTEKGSRNKVHFWSALIEKQA